MNELLASLPRESKFVFPADTKTGHIRQDSYKDHHEQAVKDSKVPRFVPYSMRHTAITRMALTGLDGLALMYWAGHKSLARTMRYIHLAAEEIQRRVREAHAKGGPNFGPSPAKTTSSEIV